MAKKICNVLSAILLVILAAVALLLIVPKVMGMQEMAVLTGSMSPGIPVGSIVYVKEMDASALRVGDVVTYKLTDSTYVTHRIAAIDTAGGTVTTKGDANDSEDATPVPYANILGRMVFHVPYLGYVSIYAKTPIGLAALCGVAIIVLLLFFLPDLLSGEDQAPEKTPDAEKNISKKLK